MQPIQQQMRMPVVPHPAIGVPQAVGESSSAPRRSAGLNEILRCCQSSDSAGIELAVTGPPHMAAYLLEEAARAGGGMVWRPRQGGLWLLGTTAGAARRALALCEGMGWPSRLLVFPAEVGVVEETMDADEAFMPPHAISLPGIAGIEERAGALSAESGHAMATIWRMQAGSPAVLAQRWMIDSPALPCPAEPDWQGYAAGLLAMRLLKRAEAGGAWPASRKRHLPLLLDMPWMPPPASLPAAPAGEGHALVLPLAAIAQASAWSALAAGHGWQLAWSGLHPAIAHLATPERLPGRLFFAEFSPMATEVSWPMPDRLVMTGCEGRTALGFVMARGTAVCSRIAA